MAWYLFHVVSCSLHTVQGQSLGAPTVESASLGILVEGRSSVNASINCHTTVTGSSDEFVLQWFRNNESVTAQQEEFSPTGAAVRFFSNNLNLNDGDGVWLENDSATYTCILMDKTADLKSAPTVFRLVVNGTCAWNVPKLYASTNTGFIRWTGATDPDSS